METDASIFIACTQSLRIFGYRGKLERFLKRTVIKTMRLVKPIESSIPFLMNACLYVPGSYYSDGEMKNVAMVTNCAGPHTGMSSTRQLLLLVAPPPPTLHIFAAAYLKYLPVLYETYLLASSYMFI
jgi:hypothetical protein